MISILYSMAVKYEHARNMRIINQILLLDLQLHISDSQAEICGDESETEVPPSKVSGKGF